MNNKLTDLNVIIDRSGSMCSSVSDLEGGLKTLIKDQQKEKGDCNFTLVEFDTIYNKVYDAVDISDVPTYRKINTGGLTALLDAIGATIDSTGKRLAAMDEKDRPASVLFIIMTDGLENSSKEYNSSQIKEMVKEQEDKYNWKFTFIGADFDAFSCNEAYGFKGHSTLNMAKSNMAKGYETLSNKVSSIRVMSLAEDHSGGFDYSAEERNDLA
jgi:hypothetical protein